MDGILSIQGEWHTNVLAYDSTVYLAVVVKRSHTCRIVQNWVCTCIYVPPKQGLTDIFNYLTWINMRIMDHSYIVGISVYHNFTLTHVSKVQKPLSSVIPLYTGPLVRIPILLWVINHPQKPRLSKIFDPKNMSSTKVSVSHYPTILIHVFLHLLTGKFNIAIEHGPFDIVIFPMNSMVDLSIVIISHSQSVDWNK